MVGPRLPRERVSRGWRPVYGAETVRPGFHMYLDSCRVSPFPRAADRSHFPEPYRGTVFSGKA